VSAGRRGARANPFIPQAPPAGQPGDPGLFGPESAAWRIARERTLLAAGPAALLLQVAHPLVAEGVKSHSNFTTDPLLRLRGTLDAVLTVTFGDTAQMQAAALRVGQRHRRVAGTLPAPAGRLPAGTPYRADDPDLALWVFATLVWTAVEATDGFVRPVPPAERDAYYRDMTRMAGLFGVPAPVLPDGYPGLERYVEDTIRKALAVGPTAALLAQQILSPSPPLLARPARPLPALLAAGVLPPAVRDAYGLRWRRRDRVAFGAVRKATRGGLRVAPARLRCWPHYFTALERIEGQTGP
jgi:uncharacterized protein (DUF2236 family)